MFKGIVGVLTIVALTAVQSVQIEQLEQVRSLGNGRLASFLSSTNRQVAVRAALALGRTKQPGALPVLLHRVNDRDPILRAMVVYGVGLIGGSGATQPIVHALSDPSDTVRAAALDGAYRLQFAHQFDALDQRKVFTRLVSMLHAPQSVLRARAATSLSSFTASPLENAGASALSAAFLRERDPYVRWHEMWALYRGYAGKASHATLIAGLHDTDEVVRIETIRAFGRRGNKTDARLLEPLTRDRSWRVQEQTLESIKVLNGGQPTDHLAAIPAGVHAPALQPDPLANLRALPRPHFSGKPQPPAAQAIMTAYKLDPSGLMTFTWPAKGPHPRVRIVTTKGNVYVELYPEWAPLTVENFLNLANEGYYDNNPWFRIVPDFVVQSGDPSADAPGPGYTIPAEENPIEQDSYVISMGLDYTNPPNAHAKRDSAASEFYITLSPQLHLNSDFTVFGRVISGFDVLGRLIESDRIRRIERIPDGTP